MCMHNTYTVRRKGFHRVFQKFLFCHRQKLSWVFRKTFSGGFSWKPLKRFLYSLLRVSQRWVRTSKQRSVADRRISSWWRKVGEASWLVTTWARYPLASSELLATLADCGGGRDWTAVDSSSLSSVADLLGPTFLVWQAEIRGTIFLLRSESVYYWLRSVGA